MEKALKHQSVTCTPRWAARAGHHTKEKGSPSTFSNAGICNSLGKIFGHPHPWPWQDQDSQQPPFDKQRWNIFPTHLLLEPLWTFVKAKHRHRSQNPFPGTQPAISLPTQWDSNNLILALHSYTPSLPQIAPRETPAMW